MAAIHWTGMADGTSWNVNGNWSLGRAPRDGDDVVIDVLSPANVRVVGQTALLNSLINRETITLTGNLFTSSSSILVNEGTLTNEGTIVLTSGDYAHESSISPFSDAIIHNTSTGVIRTEPCSGGSRVIGGGLGTFINDGAVIANVESRIEGTYINNGSLTVNADRMMLTQATSTLAPGTTITGRVDVLAGSIDVTTTNGSFTLNTQSEVEFRGNRSADVTINVRGNSFALAATLRVPVAGAVNEGTIQLSSFDGGYASSLLAAGSLTNNGTLRTIAGTGGGRTIDIEGYLDGTGRLELNNPFTFFRAGRIRQDTVVSNQSQIELRDDPSNAGTSKAKFQLDAATRFLINRNAVIFDYDGASSIDAVKALLLAGYNGGFWNDPSGINSNFIERDEGDSIGYSESTVAGVANATFAGLPVDSTAVLVRQTKVGDTNLDRAVDFSDLLALAQNYGATSGKRWSDGDFFYDGGVDFSDLLALAQHYGESFTRSGSASNGTAPTRSSRVAR